VLFSWLILIDLVIDYGQDAAHWTSFGEQALSFAVPCFEIRYRLIPDIKKYDTADTQEET